MIMTAVNCFEEVKGMMWTWRSRVWAPVVAVVTLVLISSRGGTEGSLTNPHIIYILADDLGWNDVGFHGSNQIPTPNIDALAYTGIILNNYYVAPICTPSRSALMTGKYPIHTGLQHGVIHGSTPYGLDLGEKILPEFLKSLGYGTKAIGKWHLGSFEREYTPECRGWVGYWFLCFFLLIGMQHRVIYGGEPWGLGLQETILPQYLKEVGYSTSAVGKWHLGHFKRPYLPLARGFDSHYGYWTGHQDYYDHTAIEKLGYWGFDMRRGMNISWTDYGQYTTDLFTDEAVKIIKNHDIEKPLFLYLAHLATHSANPYSPLQAPLRTVSKFKYIENKKRRLFAGMLSKLDESVGSVVAALAEANMLNNSIIIFSTDNGGPAAGFDLNAASNWPLRGVKDTLWEGGVRGAGFIWSPLLPSSKVSNDLMHITDWLPTLLFITNNTNSINDIDGVNMWLSLSKGTPSPRQEILLNIDTERNISALRQGRWKYIKGTSNDWNKWYGPDGRNGSYNWKALYDCPATKAIQQIKNLPDKTIIKKLRNAAKVVCDIKETEHDLTNDVYLFNLDKDPCEQQNLASSHQDIVKSMEEKLKIYLKTVVEPRNKETDPKSNPIYWGYAWTNWMDYLENGNDSSRSTS